ncbi:MAG: tRNA pseudouridine(55) synthase TruB [Acidobacteriota bacterium]
MNGLLIIDKPAGITSHDVVARVRRILRTKRVGHTGTLDPFATGVMVILVGQATRLAQFLDKDAKEYVAAVKLGFETDTGDRTGSPRSQVQRPKSVSVEDIQSVLPEFRGEIQQTPPMYSAKKIDGKKLYELARKGETVERKAVNVTIHELEVIDGVADGLGNGTWDLRLKVACSAGTYIRTLAEDIARSAGAAAHLTELRRTRAGRFSIGQAVTLEQLDEMPDATEALVPMEEAVDHVPKFVVAADRVGKTRNGLSTRVFDAALVDGQAVQMTDEDGTLLAIGFFDAAEKVIQPKVVLV